MILSPDIGELHLARCTVGRRTSPADFKRLTGAAHDAKTGTCTLRNEPLGKGKYTVIARFVKGALAQLTLIDGDPKYGTSWEDATAKKELARRAAHDRLLTRDLGPAHERDDAHYSAEWKFPWGKVHSSFAPRDFNTAIEIIYLRP